MRAKPTNSSDPSQSSPRVLHKTMTATPPMIIEMYATENRRCDREASRHFKPAIPPAPLSRLSTLRLSIVGQPRTPPDADWLVSVSSIKRALSQPMNTA